MTNFTEVTNSLAICTALRDHQRDGTIVLVRPETDYLEMGPGVDSGATGRTTGTGSLMGMFLDETELKRLMCREKGRVLQFKARNR